MQSDNQILSSSPECQSKIIIMKKKMKKIEKSKQIYSNWEARTDYIIKFRSFFSGDTNYTVEIFTIASPFFFSPAKSTSTVTEFIHYLGGNSFNFFFLPAKAFGWTQGRNSGSKSTISGNFSALSPTVQIHNLSKRFIRLFPPFLTFSVT